MNTHIFFLLCLSLIPLLGLLAQETTVPEVAPATRAEYLADIDRYVGLFASRNALVSLEALDYVAYFGRDGIEAFLRGLSAPDPQVRCFSAIALSRVPDARAIAPLIALLDDPAGIDLSVLADDGSRIHSCYGGPLPGAVAQNALLALSATTGLHFGYPNPTNPASLGAIIQKWKNWYTSAGQTFSLAERPQAHLSHRLPDEVQYPIPSYAKYLRGVHLCLDAGHGGDAEKIGYKRGPSGNREAESDLRVCRFLRDFLLRCGAQVSMTRDSDRFVDLPQRSEIAYRVGADLFISVHHNWSPRYTAMACTTWYHDNPDYNPASMDLARYLQQSVVGVMHQKELDRAMGLKADTLIYDVGFAVLRHLKPEIPGVLCELAYFSNLETELQMRSSDFLQREAYGIFLGLANYLYAGIPDWTVLEPQSSSLATPQPLFRLQLRDGLAERTEWGAERVSLFARHLTVELDGQAIPFQYDRASGLLSWSPVQPLAEGEHTLRLFIFNLNKNHNWPKTYRFVIGSTK